MPRGEKSFTTYQACAPLSARWSENPPFTLLTQSAEARACDRGSAATLPRGPWTARVAMVSLAHKHTQGSWGEQGVSEEKWISVSR